jgi:glycosyltransferase involved in cell wall biosynthesis
MELKRVLFISYDGMTDPLGQSQVIPYLKELSRHGYQFTILSFEKRARLEKEGHIIRKLVSEAGIEWVPLTFTARPPILAKIWDRFRMRSTAARLHRQRHFDLVHCRSYVAAEVGLELKKRAGVKMLFDMRGFWADEKVDNGQWPQDKALYRRIYNHYKKQEQRFLLGADGIVSLTEAARSYLLKQPHYARLSITVIPCCADLAHFDYHHVQPEEAAALRQELGLLPGDKVLNYLGSVGGWYLTGEMFRFFSLLLKKDPTFKMLVLTKDDPARVHQEAASLGIPADRLLVTYAERKRLPVFMALSALSIFFIRDTFSKKASSPTKHAELMGMGTPVICNDIGDTGNIIRATGTGLVVNEFDDASLQAAVDAVDSLVGLEKSMIRRAAFRYFDLNEGAERYRALYQDILSTSVSVAPSHV